GVGPRRVRCVLPAPVRWLHPDGPEPLGEQLAPARVDHCLLVLDPCPLGMARHQPPPISSRKYPCNAGVPDSSGWKAVASRRPDRTTTGRSAHAARTSTPGPGSSNTGARMNTAV